MAHLVIYVGVFISSLSYSSALNGGDSLQQRVGDYEVVRIHEVPDTNEDVVRRISFTAFGRLYVAVLNPGTDIFDPYARIRISDDMPVPLDPTGHYYGYLEGNPYHTVVLSRLKPDVYIGMISAGNDSIYIEPALFHHESAKEQDVLVFRSSSLDGTSIFRSLNERGSLAPVQVRLFVLFLLLFFILYSSA
ncbi:hypothetical protein OSTOST_24139, partial [Ostertagia ostertagi]